MDAWEIMLPADVEETLAENEALLLEPRAEYDAWIVGIGMAPIGQLEIGYLAGLTSSRIALLTNGLVLAIGAVVLGVVMPRIRRL